jgi:hypothetical protein
LFDQFLEVSTQGKQGIPRRYYTDDFKAQAVSLECDAKRRRIRFWILSLRGNDELVFLTERKQTVNAKVPKDRCCPFAPLGGGGAEKKAKHAKASAQRAGCAKPALWGH